MHERVKFPPPQDYVCVTIRSNSRGYLGDNSTLTFFSERIRGSKREQDREKENRREKKGTGERKREQDREKENRREKKKTGERKREQERGIENRREE